MEEKVKIFYKYLAVIKSFFIAENQAKADVEWKQEQKKLAKYAKILTIRSKHQYIERRSSFRNRYKDTVLFNESEIKEKRHIPQSRFNHNRWLN